MENLLTWVILLIIGGATFSSSVKIIDKGNEALVERLGSYIGKKLLPGVNLIIPFLNRVVFIESTQEKVMSIPSHKGITRDDVVVRSNLRHTTALLPIKQEQAFSLQILEIAAPGSFRRLPKTLGDFRWKLFSVL